jgi:hypothetical protein
VFAELSNGRLGGGYRVEDPIAAEILYHVARLSGDRLAATNNAKLKLLVQLGALAGVSAVDILADSIAGVRQKATKKKVAAKKKKKKKAAAKKKAEKAATLPT